MYRPTVYIQTRERPFHLRKAIPRWLAQPHVRLVLVIEKAEQDETTELLDELDPDERVELELLPKHNGGLGYIRQFILEVAARDRQRAFILADDDLMPAKGDVAELADLVLEHHVLGCGASCSFHGLMLGNNEILKTGLAFPIAGGFGHRLMAINVREAQKVGGFDTRLTCLGEDHELQREGIARLHKPWWLHTGVSFTSLGARYTPGGHNSLYPTAAARRNAERACHIRMHRSWPDYVSEPPSPYRCQWKKMMEDYIPDWRRQVPKLVRNLQEG